jgi:hypothetical protein
MKLSLDKGTTDQSVYIFIQDNTVSTGAGKTGLTFETAGLSCYYVREGGTPTQIVLATQTVDGTHSDGGFVEVDATNMPGLYRLDLPDAVCATGADNVIVSVQGASGGAPVLLEIQLAGITVFTTPAVYPVGTTTFTTAVAASDFRPHFGWKEQGGRLIFWHKDMPDTSKSGSLIRIWYAGFHPTITETEHLNHNARLDHIKWIAAEYLWRRMIYTTHKDNPIAQDMFNEAKLEAMAAKKQRPQLMPRDPHYGRFA